MGRQKILVIVPIASESAKKFMPKTKQEVEAALCSDFEADYVALSRTATHFIQSRFDEYWDTDDIIRLSVKAEKDGYQGIFVDCFGEPGVDVVRELVNIPVVGGFMPAASTALLISSRFSIVTVVDSVVPMLRTLAREMGITENLVSIRQVGIPVSQLEDEQKLKEASFKQSAAAIQEGAEAIILGCTGMLGITQWLQAELKEVLGKPAPVIAPAGAAIGMLQTLIKNKLSQSRLTYYSPIDFKTYPPDFQADSTA